MAPLRALAATAAVLCAQSWVGYGFLVPRAPRAPEVGSYGRPVELPAAAVQAVRSSPLVRHASAVVPDVEPTDNFAPPRRSQENRDRLDELASQGKYQEALGLLRAMQEGETPPTPVQYHKVVLACKAGRQWALALDLVREMQQKGLQVMLHTFGAVMDVCASAGKLDSALLVAQWMEEAGLELNRVIYTTLIKACGEAGEAPRALEVLARMRGSGLSLDYFGVLKVVELLGSAGLLEEAMQEIALIEADDTVVADYRVYFSVIRNALIHGRGDVAIRAFEMMRDMECTPPPSALKVLWDTLGRVSDPSSALDLFDRTRALASPPMAPAVYHNLRLRLLLVAGRLDAALEQLELMLKDGENVRDPRLAGMVVRVFTGPGARKDVPTVMRMLRALRAVGTSVDVVHYTMALNHVAKRRAVAEAKEVVAMMEQDGVKANDVTYTILIHLLGMDGDLEGARAMLFGMQAKGVPVSTIAMSALLNTYLKGGRAADVPALFERMGAAGMPRDARVYHIVIKALMGLGRMDQARALLERMEAEGGKNDVRTYTQKAQLYFRDRDWREAFGLLERAEEEGVLLDGPFFTVLIDGLCEQGHLSKAWEAFHAMKDHGVAPSSFTYSALLKGYADSGTEAVEPEKLHEYIKAFEQALKGGMVPSIVNYNALIDACGRARDAEAACAYFERLRRAGFKPDIISWTSLIKAQANAGNFTGAFALVEEMRHEVPPNDRTFNPLVDRAARAGRMDLVDRALELMAECGVRPDVVTYNSILVALMCRGEYQGAEELLRRMEEQGTGHNVVTYNILIDHYAKAGFWERSFAALDRMRAAGVAPDVQTYNHVLDGLVKSGQLERAEQVFADMQASGLKADTFTGVIMTELYSRTGDAAKLATLEEAMRAGKVNMVPPLFAALLGIHLQFNQVAKAMALLNERRRDGMPIKRKWYMMVASWLLEHDRDEEAFAYLDRLEAEKVLRLDGRMYALPAQELARKGLWEKVWALYGRIKDKRVGSAELASAVAVAGQRLGKLADVRKALESMVRGGHLSQGEADVLLRGEGELAGLADSD